MTAMKRLVFESTQHVRPEHLWRRYVLGMTSVVLLVAAAHEAHRSTIDKSAVDARFIETAGEMQMLSQRILLHALELKSRDNTQTDLLDLSVDIDRFAAIHAALIRKSDLTPALNAAYFDEPLRADAQVNSFIDAARDVVRSVNQDISVDPALSALMDLGHNELVETLDLIVDLYVDATEASTDTLRNLQSMTLAAVIVALLLQALFIYLPAHLSVTAKIRDLRKSARNLRINQSQLRLSNLALQKAATHDTLTELPNRMFLIERLTEALKKKDAGLSVLHLDIDRFRGINDAAGEAIGDQVLCRVRDILIEFAGSEFCLARTGGNQFMIMTDGDPEQLADDIGKAFEDPLQLSGRTYQIGFCIGYATSDAGTVDAMTLISNAEFALKAAKDEGRAAVVAFSKSLREARDENDQLAREIAGAMQDGQIVPYFQPQINLQDMSLAGIEVLARWNHPTRGLVPPDVFLPLARTEGLTRALDQLIWSKAMRQFQIWTKAGCEIPRISLNAAPDTIADPRIVPRLMVDMTAYGLTPENIVIEVLETTFIGSIHDAAAINIERLIAAGVTIELDDFGTGYASLSKLIQLSLSGIKLDRSLIHPLPSQNAESIVRAMLAIANEMSLHVVAEGIETDAQAEYLRDVGCEIGQGFGFGRPMPAADFVDWLASHDAQSRRKSAQAALRA